MLGFTSVQPRRSHTSVDQRTDGDDAPTPEVIESP